MTIAALGATLEPRWFQHEAAVADGLVELVEGRWQTRVVEGACVFLNRPGFTGGAGCALHLAARAEGEDPSDWKPETCWQLPLFSEESAASDGSVTVTLRPWRRSDWGEDGAAMAWWCTEAPEAYSAPSPLIRRLDGELRRILGDELYDLALAALDPL